MHYIESYILDKLITSKTLRNKDMRPPSVESNLYQYHLKQLQTTAYVKKVDNVYTLTPKGLAYATLHSAKLKKERPQPRLVTVLFVTNSKNELLIRTKQRQPFIGMQSLPMGKMHLNESVVTAAQREFQEKVNQSTDNLTFTQFGVSHIVIHQDNYIVSDKIEMLVSVNVSDAMLLKDNAEFYPLDKLEGLVLAPGTKELLASFKSRAAFSETFIDYVE